ncbi:amino acid ABC transporter permease [Limibacillus sp. MBR-115]|jgi:polar amino acid transport system permease protein|uniref:amino acid ABC transporter permease n=1 Tax=Limibacillus sp. MBR-115 TaxID=3156465 RepID=UPI0033990162
MTDFVHAFFNVEIAIGSWGLLFGGLTSSFMLAAIGIPLALAAGMILGVLSTVRSRVVLMFRRAWIDLFRSIPPLVLLILIYGGLPFAGLKLPAVASMVLVFFLNLGAYYGEILRAGIESIPTGQIEAARSTGLKQWQTMAYIVLPQAVRNVLPDLISNTLEGVKLTSIAAVVAIPELLYAARQAQNATYNATPIVVAALAYFILLWPVVRLLSRYEHQAIAGGR